MKFQKNWPHGQDQDHPASWLQAAMDSCFDLFAPHQHGIASKHAQVPKLSISNGKSAMLVGCGYKDETAVHGC